MALKSNFQVAPLGAIPAYFMLGAMMLDRISGGAKIDFAVFKDAESRATFKTQYAAREKAVADRDTARVAAEKAQGGIDGKAITTTTIALMEAEAAVQDTQSAMAAVAPVVGQATLNIGPDNIAKVLNDAGDLDTAKVYAFVKTLPVFEGASDV